MSGWRPPRRRKGKGGGKPDLKRGLFLSLAEPDGNRTCVERPKVHPAPDFRASQQVGRPEGKEKRKGKETHPSCCSLHSAPQGADPDPTSRAWMENFPRYYFLSFSPILRVGEKGGEFSCPK